MSKRLGGIIGCKYKTSSRHLNGFPDSSNIGSPVVGEKLTVILFTYIVVAFTLLFKYSDIKNNITVSFSPMLYY